MTTLKQAQEKAREKLMRKYDIRYFDGSTYAVDEEFQKDLDQIIKQLYEDVETNTEIRVLREIQNDKYSTKERIEKRIQFLLNKLKSE